VWPILLAAAMIAGGFWWTRKAGILVPKAAKSQGPASVRAIMVGGGRLERTLRVTGVTAAENFASVVGPQLRGSRTRGARNYARDASYAASELATAPASVTAALPSAAAFSAATQRSSNSASSSGPVPSIGASGFSGLGSTAYGLPGGSVLFGAPTASDYGGDYSLVLQKLVKAGNHVKKDEVVAEFDRENMLNRLDDFKAAVVQSETSHENLRVQIEANQKGHVQIVQRAKADLDKAQLDVKTTPVRSAIDAEFLKLAEQQAAAGYKQVLDEVKYLDISQKALVRRSEIEVLTQKIELRRAENNAKSMVVHAPMDGIAVMQATFRGGELSQVQAGDMLYPGAVFMQVVEPDSMVVDAVLNQVDSERLRIGQKATVRFDAYPDLVLPARVYGIGAMTRGGGFRSNFVKEIPVKLKLDKLDPRVIPDLSVSADIVLEEEPNAAVAPLASVFSDSATGKPFVFLKGASGWERRDVDLGLRNNIAVAIRAGLEPGAVIAAEWPVGRK